jgi:hypothetical protein
MSTCKLLFLNNLCSKTLGQIQNLDPHRLMVPIKIQVHSRRHSSNSAILLSTSGSKRWISMVMADDENSDLAANAAEQKVTRNRRKFALRISRSRIEKDCGLSAAFILRDSSENSRELLFARSGEFNSCFSTLSG